MKTAPVLLGCLVILGIGPWSPRPAAAAWPTDPAVNLPVCTATGSQVYSSIVSDGAGGAIIAWQDSRSDPGDVYASRISATGAVLWGANGVALCAASGTQQHPKIVADGAGGAIVAWQDSRNGNEDVYAQKVSADGVTAWTVNGVALCTDAGGQYYPTIAPDEAGGAVVAWQDNRAATGNVFAQRIAAGGALLWTADGVALCSAAGNRQLPVIVSDGAGGAIAAWEDFRSGTYGDIYARRISAAGTPLWTVDGVALSVATGAQSLPAIASDGAGGAIVTWFDYRNGSNIDVYTQRVSAAGVAQWVADGVPLSTATGDQEYPAITPDGAGGAIVAWYSWDSPSGDTHIAAQRVTAAGALQWATNGVTITGIRSAQFPAIAPDGEGGAIVTWYDPRLGDYDLYAQRVSAAGGVQWMVDGVALCTAAGLQSGQAIVADGAGGAIVVWADRREGLYDVDQYAQRVGADGLLGDGAPVAVTAGAAPAFALGAVRPNPSRGDGLTAAFALPTGGPARLELLDVSGRRVAAREVGSLGAGWHTVRLAAERPLPPGLYLLRLTRGADVRMARATVLK
jgi:hypothetical protein